MEDVETPQLELNQEAFLLTAPPEMPVVRWHGGQLEVLAPSPDSYVIEVLGYLSPAPVMRTGEEEETEEIWRNLMSPQHTANTTANQLRHWVPRLQGMATGVTSLQSVLRAVCDRVIQLQDGVQREGQGLGQLHQWSVNLGEHTQRRMQFLFQQFQQLGGQVHLTNQGFHDVRTFCQQGMAKMATRHQRWQQDVTPERRKICGQWQKGLEKMSMWQCNSSAEGG